MGDYYNQPIDEVVRAILGPKPLDMSDSDWWIKCQYAAGWIKRERDYADLRVERAAQAHGAAIVAWLKYPGEHMGDDDFDEDRAHGYDHVEAFDFAQGIERGEYLAFLDRKETP